MGVSADYHDDEEELQGSEREKKKGVYSGDNFGFLVRQKTMTLFWFSLKSWFFHKSSYSPK